MYYVSMSLIAVSNYKTVVSLFESLRTQNFQRIKGTFLLRGISIVSICSTSLPFLILIQFRAFNLLAPARVESNNHYQNKAVSLNS